VRGRAQAANPLKVEDMRDQQAIRTEGRKAAEREASHAINQRIFETSLDLILVVDRRGIFTRVSPSSVAILGYQPQEMIGRSAIEFLRPEDLESTRNDMRLTRSGQVARNFQSRYVHKDGRTVTLAWMGVWSQPEQRYFFIGRDMTERIALEQQLRQAQKMESIGQLTGGIAHDFNNILAVIIGMTELLADAAADDPQLAIIAETIDEAAERGAQLTQRMLAFARKQPLQPCALDLNEVVARTATLLKRTLGEDIAVTTALGDGLRQALADPSQVEDAILNLAVNARDAMPKGGRLALETANVHLDEQYAAQNSEVSPGDYVAVIVTDSGTGMPPEVIERAFEPFFTTKDVGRGTGLGLSMVYGFIKQSRGHVKIHSQVGHGTSIELYLPAVVGAEAAATNAAPGLQSDLGGRETILVVEDAAPVRRMAVNMLESLGYQVRQAEDGPWALEILKMPGTIDLLFTDMIMPHGMTGRDLFHLARELRPDLKVLFTSGYSQPAIDAQADPHREGPLLNKPYRKEKLARAVRGVLDGSSKSSRQAIAETAAQEEPVAGKARVTNRLALTA
jgi:PAS domain S-box-containing protein